MRITSKLVIRAGLSTAKNMSFGLRIEEFLVNIINQGANTKGIYNPALFVIPAPRIAAGILSVISVY
jgi:hypothetical protein